MGGFGSDLKGVLGLEVPEAERSNVRISKFTSSLESVNCHGAMVRHDTVTSTELQNTPALRTEAPKRTSPVHPAMSTCTNFAMIGAGNAGKFIIGEFLKPKADGAVTGVFCHPRHPFRALSVARAPLEPSTLVDAFSGAEVAISTVAYRAVDQQ